MSAELRPPVDGEALAALRAEERARGRGLRLGDGWDALLVRELQQALAGRIFPILLGLALMGMLLLVVAVLGDTSGLLTRGSDAFAGVLAVLSVLVCGVVPLQAFFATRQEALGESAEALLLTRLTPWAIVRGKLTATNAHTLMWVSLAAPLLALTWLLRGVSVTQVLLGLLLALLGSMVISALAVAVGTLARFERVAALVNLIGLGGILAAAFGWTSFTMYCVAGSRIHLQGEEILITVVVALPALAFAIVLARSQFTHPFENRSTHFRVLLPAAAILAFAAMAPFVTDDDAYLGLLIMGAFALNFFLACAATEEDELSPWLLLRVPKSPRRAALAAPLLPGGSRGLLWGVLMAALFVAGITATEALTGRTYDVFVQHPTGGLDSEASRAVVLFATYALFYGALGAAVRPHLRTGTFGNWLARSFVLAVVIAGSIVPMLLQYVLADTHDWTVLQIFNPFWTIADAAEQPLLQGIAFPLLALFTVLLLVGLYLRMRTGVTDIVAAGAARSAREG